MASVDDALAGAGAVAMDSRETADRDYSGYSADGATHSADADLLDALSKAYQGVSSTKQGASLEGESARHTDELRRVHELH